MKPRVPPPIDVPPAVPQIDETPQSSKQIPGVWDMVRSAFSGDARSFKQSVEEFHTQPCLRESVLWGIGLGFLFALHRFKECGNILRSCDSFVLSLTVVSTYQWLMCRRNQIYQASGMAEVYKRKKREGREELVPADSISNASYVDVSTDYGFQDNE